MTPKQKYCQVCNKPLQGKQRKYCAKCKTKAHKKQMHDNYENNKCKWLCEDGKYNIEKRKCKICGSLIFCEHRNINFKIEENLLKKEMNRLGLK